VGLEQCCFFRGINLQLLAVHTQLQWETVEVPVLLQLLETMEAIAALAQRFLPRAAEEEAEDQAVLVWVPLMGYMAHQAGEVDHARVELLHYGELLWGLIF
jgi:hypothetical protein